MKKIHLVLNYLILFFIFICIILVFIFNSINIRMLYRKNNFLDLVEI